MKFFTNKKIWSKIVIVLIFVLVFQFIVTKPSVAEDSWPIEFGGKLLSPIMSLVVTIGDAVVGELHKSIMGVDTSLLHAELGSTIWEILGRIFVVILAAAVAVGLFLLTGGLIGPLLVGIAVGYYGMQVVSDVGADKTSRCHNFLLRKKYTR